MCPSLALLTACKAAHCRTFRLAWLWSVEELRNDLGSVMLARQHYSIIAMGPALGIPSCPTLYHLYEGASVMAACGQGLYRVSSLQEQGFTGGV
jgi:hypothetical protein